MGEPAAPTPAVEVTLTISLDDQSRPSGHVRCGDLPAGDYSGWLELMALLGTLAADGPGPETSADRPGRD